MTDLTIIHDHVATRMLSLDTETIKKSCYELKAIIEEKFLNDPKHYVDENAPDTTGLFMSYNLMTYPKQGFLGLYTEIKDTFHMFRLHNNVKHTHFYMHCWLNVYAVGQYVNWHRHWASDSDAWNGFYCVQTEGSHTSYELENGTKFDIPSKDNCLVIGKSKDDRHRTYPWLDEQRDRITIAFDIVPDYTLVAKANTTNFWVPI